MTRRPLDTALILVFAVMLAATTLQVLFRYLLNDPLYGSEEIARLGLVWVTFLGAAVAARDDTHLQIDAAARRLEGRWAQAAGMIADLATLAFALLLLVLGTRLARFSWSFESSALRFPMTFFHAALPLGAALMAIYVALRLRRRLKALRGTS